MFLTGSTLLSSILGEQNKSAESTNKLAAGATFCRQRRIIINREGRGGSTFLLNSFRRNCACFNLTKSIHLMGKIVYTLPSFMIIINITTVKYVLDI